MFISKKYSVKKFFLVHMVLWEQLRRSGSIANQSFCWSDISRVQLKINLTVGERLLASDQSQFDNTG